MAHVVYYGKRDAMIAEVSAFDTRLGGVSEENSEYLVLPVGADGDYDTESFATLREARSEARHLAGIYNATMTLVE